MTEAQIQRQVLDYLAAKHTFAFRLNTAAIKTEKRFFRSHGLGRGAADILAIISKNSAGFLPVWIECKSRSGRQSAEQKSFQAQVESLGHAYVLARSIDNIQAHVG